MNLRFGQRLIAIVLFALLPASVVWSQELDGVLKKALGFVANGQCPSSLMSPLLVDACEKNMPGFGSNIKQRGTVSGVEFKGIQQTQMGPADAYRVKFSGGTSMMWLISVGSDDKIIVLWSGG